MQNPEFYEFLYETSYEDLPADVVAFSRRCLLDLIGVLAAGSQTPLSRIIRDHVAQQFGSNGDGAHVLLDGRKVSPAGAALANGMTIDAIDAHDGYRPTKGHIGCHLLPAILAFSEAAQSLDGKELLTNLVIGYEIAARAGIALHASVPDYHTSGAWGAVSSAAIGTRIFGLDAAACRHAIGIGEYHGPRSQMMRCIDHPTMLKDGSGWGAMAGVSAAYLARDGFTGAPAITVEGEDVASFWQDLGSHWTILEQYFKPYPVCRWAQPAAEAALWVKNQYGVDLENIDSIEVFTFHEGCRLAMREPENTEQAQYSLPFPVAAGLVFGKLGPSEVSGEALHDKRVLALSNAMILTEEDQYNERFPAERLAHVAVRLKSGEVHVSDTHTARGDPEDHLTDQEIVEKYRSLSEPVLGKERARRIETLILDPSSDPALDQLLAELVPPAQ